MPQVEGEKVKGEDLRVRGFEVNGLLVEPRGGATSQSASVQWKTTTTTIFASATTATKVPFQTQLLMEDTIGLVRQFGRNKDKNRYNGD